MTRNEYIEEAKAWLCYFLITASITIVFIIFRGYMEAVFMGCAAFMFAYEALCYFGSAQEILVPKPKQIQEQEAIRQEPPSRPPGADQYHFQEGEDIYGS